MNLFSKTKPSHPHKIESYWLRVLSLHDLQIKSVADLDKPKPSIAGRINSRLRVPVSCEGDGRFLVCVGQLTDPSEAICVGGGPLTCSIALETMLVLSIGEPP